MRHFVLALMIAFAISGSALAGDVPAVDYVPPPPPATSPANTEGDMGAGGFAEMITEEIAIAIFNIFAR